MSKVIIESTNFWKLDLDEIEKSFLEKNRKITDLEVGLDSRVPVQGTVLSERTINIDNVVKNLTPLQQIKHFLGFN